MASTKQNTRPPGPPANAVEPFGPTLAPTGTTFRAWAPRARRLNVILHPGTGAERAVRMERDDGGFFGVHCAGVGAGSRYFLQRDEHRPQPDPASPFQPDGIWGPSEVIDHAFDWTDAAWRGTPAAEIVLYELHVGAFSSAGNYDGVVQRLDHLAGLGVNAIKLMPLATFPGARNWGYDGVFHLAPFSGYGRPERLQALIDACHARGISVLLDVVTNHFGPEGNAMWMLARSFFARDKTTPWGPGPRFDREAVLGYFAQMARHYRRHYHFDGLRIDAFDAIPKEHRREHLKRMVEAFAAELPPGAHGAMLLESVDNELSLLRRADSGVSVLQLCFDFQRSAHRLLTGESHRTYSDYTQPAEHLARCATDGFSMLQRFSERRGRQIGEAPQAVDWATVVNYLQNHDTAGNRYRGERQERLIDARTWRAALAYLLLQPGIPYLFMGSEWATKRPFLFFCDLSPDLGRRVSRSRRRGLEDVDPKTLSVHPPDPQDPEALAQSTLAWQELTGADHARCLQYTRQLIALRREFRPAMTSTSAGVRSRATGPSLTLDIADREGQPAHFRLLANFGDTTLDLPPHEQLLFTSDPLDDPDHLPPKTTVLLRADPDPAPI